MKRILLVLMSVLTVAGVSAQERTPITKSNYAAAERFSPAKVRQMYPPTVTSPPFSTNTRTRLEIRE